MDLCMDLRTQALLCVSPPGLAQHRIRLEGAHILQREDSQCVSLPEDLRKYGFGLTHTWTCAVIALDLRKNMFFQDYSWGSLKRSLNMGVAPLDAEFHCASGDIKISFLTRMDLRTISLQRQYMTHSFI